MTETFLIVENAILQDEIRLLRVQLDACHQILERNLKDLIQEKWRPHPEILDLEKEPTP